MADFEERFRITITMSVKGNWSFTIIGLHTNFEVLGLLHAICLMLARKAVDSRHPDPVEELIRGGRA